MLLLFSNCRTKQKKIDVDMHFTQHIRSPFAVVRMAALEHQEVALLLARRGAQASGAHRAAMLEGAAPGPSPVNPPLQ